MGGSGLRMLDPVIGEAGLRGSNSAAAKIINDVLSGSHIFRD
jgi:hypothetical protein